MTRNRRDRIDLYLIHWPNPKVDLYVQAWRALIEARERGLVRHIGLSNFLPEHIERLVAETAPDVDEIRQHALLTGHNRVPFGAVLSNLDQRGAAPVEAPSGDCRHPSGK
ncbi:aldo/keto reductase [Micromonospora sp. H61]|uniref:aldo/keto reductase n=1 Tax=unclassified Micromonospora TaxID=2617518 RepID=UPI0027DC113E|nr:aldo/keto reductase [Micromonospora sp. H61]